MTEAPSIKEALGRAREYIKPAHPGDIQADADLRAVDEALATLQPEGERREAIARAIAAYNEVWNGWPELEAKNVDECREEAMKAALLASGLVQDEAGIRADERKKLRNRLDSHLNDFLCEMKEGCDDSMSGFNDAWDVVRKVLDAADIRSARDGGAET